MRNGGRAGLTGAAASAATRGGCKQLLKAAASQPGQGWTCACAARLRLILPKIQKYLDQIGCYVHKFVQYT